MQSFPTWRPRGYFWERIGWGSTASIFQLSLKFFQLQKKRNLILGYDLVFFWCLTCICKYKWRGPKGRRLDKSEGSCIDNIGGKNRQYKKTSKWFYELIQFNLHVGPISPIRINHKVWCMFSQSILSKSFLRNLTNLLGNFFSKF